MNVLISSISVDCYTFSYWDLGNYIFGPIYTSHLTCTTLLFVWELHCSFKSVLASFVGHELHSFWCAWNAPNKLSLNFIVILSASSLSAVEYRDFTASLFSQIVKLWTVYVYEMHCWWITFLLDKCVAHVNYSKPTLCTPSSHNPLNSGWAKSSPSASESLNNTSEPLSTRICIVHRTVSLTVCFF